MADGILLVYDITDQGSFQALVKWLAQAKNEIDKYVPILLIGNKIDLGNKRVISFAQGLAFAQKNDLLFLETSAKSNENVD